MITNWILGGALVTVALAAVWFDVRERRIPNTLTVPALVVALLVQIPGGLTQLWGAVLGAAVCMLLALPFFLAGGLGGGDVKLLTAFGAFLGFDDIAPALLVTAFVGGGLALVVMIRRGAVLRTFWNLYLLLSHPVRKTLTGWQMEGSQAQRTLATPGVIAVPYGVAISTGALYAWFLT